MKNCIGGEDMTHSDFTMETNCKGKVIGHRKVTNNNNWIVYYNGSFVGELRSRKDAINFINNLVKHNKLEYTP